MTDRDLHVPQAVLALPPAPVEPTRPGFPWIASIAPVAGAGAIWAITGSAFALVFAVLGPLIAVATMLDARRNGARVRRRALADRGDALARLRDEVARRHDAEREDAWRRFPPAREAIERAVPAWRMAAPAAIVVGRGSVPSGLRLDGVAVDETDVALLAEAALLDGAPIHVDPRRGLGFVGDLRLARAAARAALVQSADATGPDGLAVRLPEQGWEWATRLPHLRGGVSAPTLVVHEAGPASAITGPDVATPPHGETMRISVAAVADALPPGIGTVVRLHGPRAAVLQRPGRGAVDLEPELVSAAEAAEWADRLHAAARRAGLATGRSELPRRVPLASLLELQSAGSDDRSRIPAVVGLGGDGAVELDLASGPHALVAGTTGSGKSEFLVAWITALAFAHPPQRVAFLLVDFKGGAAFAPVAALPHVTGIVTDLDDAEAARAVASLRAEVRHRELVLRAADARELAGLPDGIDLPRLVVVVDEFQAMVERFPELGEVIADLAARGRSLGVHLVLASQRPNGVVREQVMANCGIRVSLRVLQRADSLAVVGCEDAALLESGRAGLAIADPGDGRPVRFQSAIAEGATIDEARMRHAHADPPRRPWLDPLPERVTLDSVHAVLAHGRSTRAAKRAGPATEDDEALLLGVVDEPERQRRSAACWRPAYDGPLAVLGSPRSGRSALLAAIAAQVEQRHGPGAVLRLEGPRSAVWDALAGLDASTGSAGSPALVVVDDLDTRFASWPDDYRLTALARVEAVLRRARGSGTAVVVSASRLSGSGAGIRDAFTTTAFLRHGSRADLVHAGGAGDHWSRHDPPGAGEWRGLRAQFLHADPPPAAPGATLRPLRLDGHAVVAVASATPDADVIALRAWLPRAEMIRLGSSPQTAGLATEVVRSAAPSAGPHVIVGDAEDWGANWSLAHLARSRAVAVVHGGPVELRSLIRASELPPLLDDPVAQCWLAAPEHPPVRVAWNPHDEQPKPVV